MKNTYETPLNSRYASKEMQYIFSPDRKFTTWRRLWVALAESEMELGLPVTQAQVDELKEQLPDTFVSDYGGDPNSSGGWRFKTNGDKSNPTERYALLREQMRYDLINWQLMLSNSPSGEED